MLIIRNELILGSRQWNCRFERQWYSYWYIRCT